MKAKQVIVIRKDLNMRKGKMVAQGAHASLLALMSEGRVQTNDVAPNDYYAFPYTWEIQQWMEGDYTKVCVGIESESELMEICSKAKEKGILCAYVEDLGRTEFHGVPTKTAVAIGPAYEDVVNEITGHLKLL